MCELEVGGLYGITNYEVIVRLDRVECDPRFHAHFRYHFLVIFGNKRGLVIGDRPTCEGLWHHVVRRNNFIKL